MNLESEHFVAQILPNNYQTSEVVETGEKNVTNKAVDSEQLDKIDLYPLQKINTRVAGRNIEAILDSSTEISILNTADFEVEAKGRVLESVRNEKVQADLAKMGQFITNHVVIVDD
ncbi:hypothetical protein NPIL_405291 [Nephila pilipes]|uniref:Uncharacterized protein n=1 Tax=Nephila pilipes TaxID=299642 RepID=A0A8X6QTZ5_NEPPI|nr:hypothetical protein NPIL_405291 [Nephila pilipes]